MVIDHAAAWPQGCAQVARVGEHHMISRQHPPGGFVIIDWAGSSKAVMTGKPSYTLKKNICATFSFL